jgi:hypothetical protein
MLLLTLPGCGADRVWERAHAQAERHLREELTSAVACVAGRADQLGAAVDRDDVTSALAGCAGIALLDRSLAEMWTVRALDSEHGTLAVTSDLGTQHVVVTFYTDGFGVAEAGVSRSRSTLATCWRVVVPAGDAEPEEIAGTDCTDAALDRMSPSSELPFEDLGIPTG